MKRSLTLISLILALCVLLPGWAALAEDEGVQYFNASEVRFGTITDYKTIKNRSSSWYDLSSGWYVVEGNVSLSSKTTLRVTGDVHLILCDGSTLTAGDGVYPWSAGASFTSTSVASCFIAERFRCSSMPSSRTGSSTC